MLRVSVTAALVLALAACSPKTEPAAPAAAPADATAAAPAAATPAMAATDAPAANPAPATPAPAAAAANCPSGGKAVDAAAWAKYVPWKSDNAGVKKTASGLEYVVLKSGPTAGKSPSKDQVAEVFYEGRLNTGGCAFDSAYARNESASFPVGAVVPGFSEALTLMKPGDHWLIYLPANLAYGPSSPTPAIPPNSDLVFELQLEKVQ